MTGCAFFISSELQPEPSAAETAAQAGSLGWTPFPFPATLRRICPRRWSCSRGERRAGILLAPLSTGLAWERAVDGGGFTCFLSSDTFFRCTEISCSVTWGSLCSPIKSLRCGAGGRCSGQVLMSSAGSSSVSTQRTDGEERTCKDRRFPEPGVTAVLWNQLFPVISCLGREGRGGSPGGTRPRPLPTLGRGSRRLLRGLGSRAQPGSVCGSERAGSGPGTAVGALLSRPRGLVSARAVLL